jgi:hypothetical protein
LFWGKFLNRTWTLIKATEIISSYLCALVQGWKDHKSRKTTGALSDTQRRDRDGRKAIFPVFAENISTAQPGPHDSSGVAM